MLLSRANMPSPDLRLLATGHAIANVQLSPDEANQYANIPVWNLIDTGFYAFPPNKDGIVKLAKHDLGYVNLQQVQACDGTSAELGVPRTKMTPGAEDGALPKEALKELRDQLARVFPKLAKKDFINTRLCWYVMRFVSSLNTRYTDTPTGDWLIDYHPTFENLVLATGGSGKLISQQDINQDINGDSRPRVQVLVRPRSRDPEGGREDTESRVRQEMELPRDRRFGRGSSTGRGTATSHG